VNFPLYIYYELLIRLSEINPELGDYLSSSTHAQICILRTTLGTMHIPEELLDRQFNNPSLITISELEQVIATFKDTVR